MNRYEALNALGLQEGASEQDVRLAYYGLKKAVETQDFSEDKGKISERVELQLERAKECRDYLLANGTSNEGHIGRSGGAVRGILNRKKASGKMEITAERDKQARLAGLERLRINLLTYRDQEHSRRMTCILVIVIAIVVGFVALRYVRVVAPRAIIMVAVGAAAIVSSTLFTTAHMQCRAAKRHLLDVDERIHKLRVALGIEEEEAEEESGAGKGLDPSELPASAGRTAIENADEFLTNIAPDKTSSDDEEEPDDSEECDDAAADEAAQGAKTATEEED